MKDCVRCHMADGLLCCLILTSCLLQCYSGGSYSRCDDNSGIVRICYCSPSTLCPQPVAPARTLVMTYKDNAQISCTGGFCPAGTVAQYRCTQGYAFQTHSVWGGIHEAACVNGAWASTPPACVVSGSAHLSQLSTVY